MYSARPERPLPMQAPPDNRRTMSMGLDAAPTTTFTGLDAAPPLTLAGLDAAPLTTSTSSNRSQAEMKTLCRPPVPRPLKPKAGNNRGHYTKKQIKPPTNHNLATSLDQPNTYWRCPFCPVEYNTFLALKTHNDGQHGGQLFRLECGQCGFQTDSPKLLRGHQARMHAVRETDTLGESVAAVSADAATTIAPVSASESTSAILVNEDTATAIAGAAGTITGGKTGELLCQGTLQNNPATHKNRGMGPPPSSNSNMQNEAEANPPQVNTPTPESAELLASIANLDNVFLGPPATLWPEDELQNIEET